MRNDLHQAVKNVIHNELGITKEELRLQIQEEISKANREMIEKLVGQVINSKIKENPYYYNQLISDYIRQRIDKIINKSANYFGLQTFETAVKHHLADYVANEVMKQLDLSVKTKEPGKEQDEG